MFQSECLVACSYYHAEKKVLLQSLQFTAYKFYLKNVSKMYPPLKEKHSDLDEYICMSCKILLSKGEKRSENAFLSNETVDDNLVFNKDKWTSESDQEFVEGDVGQEIMFLSIQKLNSALNFREKIHWLTITSLLFNFIRSKNEFYINYRKAHYIKNIQNLYSFGSYPPDRKKVTIFF